ncbi:MAG: DMT family transporter [Oscillospiraceae bacterium]|nr:DMT family transporter [Oscillospiraceae bacterium]
MSKNLKGNLLLVLAALIWGVSFVMQDKAAELLPAFTINGVRSLIGTAALLPLIIFRSKKSGAPIFEGTPKQRKNLILAGILCGAALCIATNFQQFGIALYPAEAAASGRSGFITALYVVLVPVFGLFMKKRASFTVWIGAALAALGMFLLCQSGSGEGIYTGDIIVLFCAFAFTAQILCVDSFGEKVDGVKLSALQFLVCGVLSLVLMFIFESPSLSYILKATPYILYLGIMSCGVAYTLQIVGQQYSKNPTVASILMSLESVFAALSGALISGEVLSVRELVGCAVMFAAIVLSQLPHPKHKELKKS